MTAQTPTRTPHPRRGLRVVISTLIACLAVVLLPSTAWAYRGGATTDPNPACADGWNSPTDGGVCSASGSDDGGAHSGNIAWSGWSDDVPYLSDSGWAGVKLSVTSGAHWYVTFEFEVICAFTETSGDWSDIVRVGADDTMPAQSISLPACAAGRGLKHVNVYVYDSSRGRRLDRVAQYWPASAPERPATDVTPQPTPTTGGSYPDDTPDANGCSWTKPLACIKAALTWAFVPQASSLQQFDDLGKQALNTFPASWFAGYFTTVDSLLRDCTHDVGGACTTRNLAVTLPGGQKLVLLEAGHSPILPAWADGVVRVLIWLSVIGGLAGFAFKRSLPVVNG